MEKSVSITKQDVEKIAIGNLKNEDDTGWLTKVQSGKNLYDKVLDPDDILMSSIVAKETLRDDLLCFLFAIKKADTEATLDLYNKVVEIAKLKILAKKEAIQEQFLNEIAGENNFFSTHGMAGHSRRRKSVESEEAKAFKAMSQSAPEGTVAELSERYGKSKSEIRKLKRDGQLHTLELS